MNEGKGSEDLKQIGVQVIKVICGVVCMGALMSVRYDVHSHWIRAGLAGCAFGLCCFFVSWAVYSWKSEFCGRRERRTAEDKPAVEDRSVGEAERNATHRL